MTTSESFKEGEAYAFQVLTENWADPTDQKSSFPVDMAVIARKLNIALKDGRFPERETLGVTIKDDSGAQILLSRDLNKTDMSLLVAYNLGRILEKGTSPRFGWVDTEASIADEGISDFAKGFAAGVLMPASAVRTLFAEGKSIKRIAKTFGVNQAILADRLTIIAIVAAMEDA